MTRARSLRLLGLMCLACCALAPVAWASEEFSFDASEFEKKPFEFGGYFEFKPERSWLNHDGALYKLNYYNRAEQDTQDRYTSTLKLNGKFTQGIASLNLRADLEVRNGDLISERIKRFDEAYVSFKPDPGFTLDIGKVALKWGKGYAWSPVGFVERPKDPNDVELAREGYTMLTADFIRNFDGDLKTVAFTPLLLPVSSQVNQTFGKPDHLNFAGKLYLLYQDTDIDFMWLGSGSRSQRFGMDFSRNLSSALEIHGELARIQDFQQLSVSPSGRITSLSKNVTSALLGLRYLTEKDTTYIVEYYRNGTGFTETQGENFYNLVDNGLGQFEASGVETLLNKAANASLAGYGKSNPMRNYAYLRISQKEPFDIVYFTPSLTMIANLDDHSFSLTPELLYTGITNLDLRLRAAWLVGDPGSEFGEKQNSRKLELMMRYYF